MERFVEILYWMEFVLRHAMLGAFASLVALIALGCPDAGVQGAAFVAGLLLGAWLAAVVWCIACRIL